MRKQNKLHLSILLTCLLFGGLSCKKYEEGPCISLRSKFNRLIGAYKLEYLYVNGIDSTSAFMNQNCNGILILGERSETHIWGRVVFTPFNNDSLYECSFNGDWNLNNKKEILNIVRFEDLLRHGPNPIGSFLIVGSVNWKIKRLTNKQLWLETSEGGTETWVHLLNTN